MPDSPLKEIILNEIRTDGPMTVARFMDLALYHPDLGYYQRVVEIGKKGDFYTSPHVSALFGQLIGKQLEEMWELMSRPSVFQVVEMGAGHGHMAADILNSEKCSKEFKAAVSYSIIETSDKLRDQQQELLGEKVSWLESLEALDEQSVTGCILSNELVDSFPVHKVCMRNGEMSELYLTEENGELVEQPGQLSDTAIAEYFGHIELSEGIETEVNLNALAWMREVSRVLERGYVITIDYGLAEADYYSSGRMQGTLRSFHQHQVSGDVFRNPGEQDLTAHVNFTALARAGEKAGLRTEGFTDQSRFLLGIGEQDIAEALAAFPGAGIEDAKRRVAIRSLFHPQMMGNTFRVLIQSKGLDSFPISGLKGVRGKI
jgi:SAM-dependent MidA family methyltransferase